MCGEPLLRKKLVTDPSELQRTHDQMAASKLISLLTTPNAERAFKHELNDVINLDDARFGNFGLHDLANFYSKFQDMVDGYDSRVEEVNVIENANGRVEEAELYLQRPERTIRLPVAVVYDQTDTGMHIRLYYSNYPIDQTHRDRTAILPTAHALDLPVPVARYQEAFAKGDLDATLAMLEPNATIQEPSGGTFGSAPGQTGLTDFYRYLYSFGGGITLEHCNAITDDKSCALEYNILKVGNIAYSPQAGLGIYDFNETKLTRTRIYDDFVPS